MTDQEKQNLINDIIVELKNNGVNVADAYIETSLDNIAYFVGYNSERKPIRLNATAITNNTASLNDLITNEVERATTKEEELQEGLTEVRNRVEVTEVVNNITWDSSGDMNDFTTAGVYNIEGERTNANDNLPISNSNPGHTVSGRLIVLDSSIDGTGDSQDKCITQLLTLSNRTGEDGNTYIRTASGASLDSLTWKPWATQQTNVNVGQVTSLDSFIDNGIYSGVFVESGVPSTFVMIVINDYFVGVSPRRVSQFLYKLNKADGTVSFIYRVGVGNSVLEWGSWVDSTKELQVLIDKNATDITNEETRAKAEEAAIRKLITDLIGESPETLNSIHEISSWILDDQTGAAAMAKAISENKAAIETEATRAQEAESGLTEYITTVDEDYAKKIAEIKSKALHYNTLHATTSSQEVKMSGKSVDGENLLSFSIPAATSESAGVMTAEDKKEQVKITPLVNGDIIVGQTREIYSRQGKVDSATFLKRTTAGSTSVSDGVASVKQIGGNIVKNLVDTSFVGSETLGVVNKHIYYFSASLFNGQLHFAETSTGVYSGWKQHSIISKATSDSVTITVEGDNAFNVLLINLTETFGVGKEPTKEECDRMFGIMDALPQGLTIANPTAFTSTGFNQFNPDNVLDGKAIVDNALVSGDKKIAVIECLPCKVGTGENNGYCIHGEFGEDIKVYLTPLNPIKVDGELYMHELTKDATTDTYVPQIKGYMLVEVPTTANLCVHFIWSEDKCERDSYEPYFESKIELPTIPEISEWGLAGISASGTMAQDTIDLDRMVYTKRIGCVDLGSLSWTAPDENNAAFMSPVVNNIKPGEYSKFNNLICEPFIVVRGGNRNNGYRVENSIWVHADHKNRICIQTSKYTDSASIKAALQGVMLYYELATPEEYPIVTKTAPNYIGSDYGVEEFTGSKIPLAANILFYMRSLVGETRNFLDRLMVRLGTSDVTAVADKIADAIIPTTEGTDVEPTEVTEL